MANPTYNLLETLSSYCICKYNDFKKGQNRWTKQKISDGNIVWVQWCCDDGDPRTETDFFLRGGVVLWNPLADVLAFSCGLPMGCSRWANVPTDGLLVGCTHTYTHAHATHTHAHARSRWQHNRSDLLPTYKSLIDITTDDVIHLPISHTLNK